MFSKLLNIVLIIFRNISTHQELMKKPRRYILLTYPTCHQQKIHLLVEAWIHIPLPSQHLFSQYNHKETWPNKVNKKTNIHNEQYSSVDSFVWGVWICKINAPLFLRLLPTSFAGLEFTTKKFLWYKNATHAKTELLAVFNSNHKEVFLSCRIQVQAPCRNKKNFLLMHYVWTVLYIPELHLGCKEDGNRGFDLLQSLHCHADKTGQIPVFHLFPSCPACS